MLCLIVSTIGKGYEIIKHSVDRGDASPATHYAEFAVTAAAILRPDTLAARLVKEFTA